MGVMNDLLTNDLFPQAQLSVNLQGATDLAGFRRTARALLAQHMLPEQVSWHVADAPTRDLFADPPASAGRMPGDAPPINVPPEFVPLCEAVILHCDNKRFDLLYRILWRLVHEPGLRHDPLDVDMTLAQHMAQAVQRDMHKMKAFVRFRSVQDETFRSDPEVGPLHVAWFEPEHHIVEAVAPFFARRFTQMRWAILTPECSVEWDCVRPPSAPGKPDTDQAMGQLRFGPGARKEDAPPPDAGEQLWLAYYRNIFNPARRKVRSMQKKMPRKYWHTLPQAELISPLTAAAI